MSEQLQPLESLNQQEQEKEEAPLDPAKADYKEGRDYMNKGEYAQAGMALHNAMKGFEEMEDEQGIANCADRLGDVCVAREEYQMALEHFQRAFDICAKENDIFSTNTLNKKIAGVYKRTGDLDTALSLLFDIFDHYTQLRDPKGTVEILEVIAEIYQEQGNKEKAADAYMTIAGLHRNFSHIRQADEFEEKAKALTQV